MSPADPAMLDVYEVKYRSTEDAFREDWRRVGESLGAAMGAFAVERGLS